MKRLLGLLILTFGFSVNANAQFRADANVEPKLNTAQAMTDGDSFFSRLFDPSRYSMHQTYSMSVASSSFGSYGLSMFTNTFMFRPSDDVSLSADVSAVYSPFNSFGNDAFSKQVNGVYLTSARLDWKLSENSSLRIQYLGGPSAMYGGYGGFGDYGSGFYGGSGYYGNGFNNPIVVSPTNPQQVVLTSTPKRAIPDYTKH